MSGQDEGNRGGRQYASVYFKLESAVALCDATMPIITFDATMRPIAPIL